MTRAFLEMLPALDICIGELSKIRRREFARARGELEVRLLFAVQSVHLLFYLLLHILVWQGQALT